MLNIQQWLTLGFSQPTIPFMLSLIKDAIDKAKTGHILSLYKCSCGNTKILPRSRVKSGAIKSCGCIVGKNKKHGYKGTRTYRIWSGMKGRVCNTNNKDYPRYGGRGIALCPDWFCFEGFLKDMGECPGDEYSIERVDNNKGYNKENCKWVNIDEQHHNKRNSMRWLIDGVWYERTRDACKAHGVSDTTIWKWCMGYTCQRGKYYPPKNGCKGEKKYADMA